MCQRIIAASDSTIAVEVFEAGLLRKRKLILFFDDFSGELFHSPECPGQSRLALKVDARSVECREPSLSKAKRHAITTYARDVALAAGQHPEILFQSTYMKEKPLRGFVMNGQLTVRGVTRPVRANLDIGPMKQHRVQIDADASIRLNDLGIEAPSAWLGLTRVRNEAMIHVLLWTDSGGHVTLPATQ